ncbi:MAG: glutamine--fructose-6-phosphate transaminase (isomerizing) [Bacillota bacterium]
MCGIVGYIGNRKAKSILIDGLKKLEYRGYDSAGIALYEDDNLFIKKEKGKIVNLEKSLNDKYKSNLGIAHTRWATHGKPSKNNSHPHYNKDQTIAVVHNGIIENYIEIKEWLKNEHNYEFVTETDTEVVGHLIDYYYKDNLKEAFKKTIKKLKGAFALGVISAKEPDKLFTYRKDSPLVIGIGDNEKFIASDVPAILKHTNKVIFLENNEMGILQKDKIEIFDKNNKKINKEIVTIDWTLEDAQKDGYPHFTIKEINEQPKGIQKVLDHRLNKDNEIILQGVKLDKKELENISKIYIIACGTSYHAGLIGKFLIEKYAKIPVLVEIASEFRYREPVIDENTLVIAVSQSGETIDTLKAIRQAKNKGARIMSIVNVVGSSIDRESDDVFYTWAGPEIGVASTKAYTTQLATFYLLSLFMAKKLNKIELKEYENILNNLRDIPKKIQEILDKSKDIEKIAKKYVDRKSVFFIGRGLDAEISYEASLKLKEISYINSFAIEAGELKHGTIALIEKNSLVVSLATQEYLYDKMRSNMQEVNARDGKILSVVQKGKDDIKDVSDDVLFIPNTIDALTPLLSIIPMQLLAYYVSVEKGNDVDQPRNLAKSVTVE